MGCLVPLAVLLLAAAIISFLLSLAGVLVGVVSHLLPLALAVGAVAFFIKGGKITIELPDSWRRR